MQRSIGKERATVLPKESPLILWSGNRPRKDATRSTLMLVILLKDQPKVLVLSGRRLFMELGIKRKLLEAPMQPRQQRLYLLSKVGEDFEAMNVVFEGDFGLECR